MLIVRMRTVVPAACDRRGVTYVHHILPGRSWSDVTGLRDTGPPPLHGVPPAESEALYQEVKVRE